MIFFARDKAACRMHLDGFISFSGLRRYRDTAWLFLSAVPLTEAITACSFAESVLL